MKEINIKIPASPEITESASFVMLGDGFDEIEVLAPVDVMRRAGMSVFTVSMTENRVVRGATGNLVVADMSISDLKPEMIDWLIFPGADKSEAAVNISLELQAIVKSHWEKGGNVAAICAAPALVLGPLGIITGTTLEFALAIVRKAKGAETEKALREGMVIS